MGNLHLMGLSRNGETVGSYGAIPVVTPNLITGLSLGGPLSNINGVIGMAFLTDVGSSITVTHLSRWRSAGNSQTHTLYIGLTAPSFGVLDSVSVDMSTGSVGDWVTVELASPILLNGNTGYFIVSSEVLGTDNFADDTTFSAIVDSTAIGSVYDTNDPPTAIFVNTAGAFTFGPVNAVVIP